MERHCLYNVAVRRDNGNTYVEVVRALDYEEALQIEMQRVNADEKVLSAMSTKAKDETFWYGNFLVTKGKNGVFGIYKCTSRGEKIGKQITTAEDFNKAIKKAKLLQYGYEKCLASERRK